MVTRRAFISAVGALAGFSAFGLAGCGSGNPATDSAASLGADGLEPLWAEPQTNRAFLGSPDPCDVRVGLIMGPPSMGLTQFLIAADEGLTENRFTYEFDSVDYVDLSARFNNGEFDLCTLPSNIGPILYNNDELKNDYMVVSINNLGVLYVMTTDASISSLADLSGRRVYSYGEGGTPEYTIQALLKKMGLAQDMQLEFKSGPLEVLNMLQQEENAVAILPQPFCSLAKTMVDPLYFPVDITEEWDKAFADTGSQCVTTTTIVNKAFLAEHEQAVVEYLQLTDASVKWSLQNIPQAAALQEELGSFLNNDVALDAMPQISMVCLTGSDMKEALQGFLSELYAANPDSIGGAEPADDFYYMPPTGFLD